MRLLAVIEVGLPHLLKVGLADSGDALVLGLDGNALFVRLSPLLANVRDHVGAKSPVKAILIQIGIELREGEGVFGVVGVGDVEPALAELSVNAPAFKHLPVLVDVLRALRRDAAQLAQVRLIGLAAAPLNLLLHLRRLLLMDGGIALVALHLLQAPCLVHLADARGTANLRLLAPTLIQSLPG